MARRTASTWSTARQTMVEPEPLSHPPIAPAFSPARITEDNWGMSASR